MLINCSECGKKFSDKAAACPHCGCPMEAQTMPKPKIKKILNKRTKRKLFQFGILAGVILIIALVIIIVNSVIAQKNREVVNRHLYNNGGTPITSIADAFEDWANSH